MVLYAKIEYIDLENDYGHEVAGIRATCPKCLHTTESYGDGSSSIRRCLVLLKEECGCATYFIGKE